MVIVKDTDTPVKGKDTVVTADMRGGVAGINSGNVEVLDYDATTGAGIRINAFSDIRRAVANDKIRLNNYSMSFGEPTVAVSTTYAESTTVNLYDNKGRKQKVAYTHNDGEIR